MTLDGTTLQLGKDDSMSVKTNLYTSLSTGEGDETVVNNGTFDLNGHSTQLGYLSGSGQVINSGETTSVITLNKAWNSTFSGTVTGAVNFVKTGEGKWYLTGKSDWTGTDSFDIQEGIVILSGKRADGDQRRFMSGNLTIGENAQLTLNSTDTLGNAMNGSWEGQGLDVNILGPLEIAASGNQTSRFINYNLYGGTINITNASGNIFYVNDITTLTSYAKYGTQDVTETSVINETLAVREGSCELTVNVEDGVQDTDMLWTGWFKNVNNNQKGSIEKVGDGTLRLTSMEGKTFDHKNGTNVEAGRLILDAGSMTGSDVTVAQDAVFAAVNGSVIGKNLNVNGTYELILEEIAASEEEFQLMISDQLLFGDYATARINASGDVNWNALNGKTILRLHSADYATEILDKLGDLLASDPYYPYVQLITEGADIVISSFEFNEVPEPASWLLLLFGAAGLAWSSRGLRLKIPRFATPRT
ncbi:MAG: PEP-CTERM sorting domain-containing protein [Thermoguttaceae bacterium]|nr:PEP-CTERM sorting domain-containing protein [Thermoguttaceae bacterium]